MNAFDDLSDQELGDDENIPGTVFNRRQARILKNVVIVMGAMLILGTLLLVALLARKGYQAAGKPKQEAAAASVTAPLSDGGETATPLSTREIATDAAPRQLQAFIPKGARFVSGNLDGQRYLMTLQTGKGDLVILFFDLRTWRLVAKAELKQEQ